MAINTVKMATQITVEEIVGEVGIRAVLR